MRHPLPGFIGIHWFSYALVATLAGQGACKGAPSESDADTDADVDTDSDADTDTDSDTQAPSITITSPLDGETVAGAKVEFTTNAADNVGVSRVVFSVDGATVADANATPWSATWDSTGEVDGNYLLRATAEDAAGNLASASVEIVVENGDLSPDLVRIINPVDGAAVCGDVTVEAAVAASGAAVTFELDGTDVGSDATEPYQWSWATTGTSNGVHLLRATAKISGAQVQNTIAVDVENTGAECDNLPSVAITEPAGSVYTFGKVAIAADASDDIGVAHVQFFVDNAMLIDDSSVPYETQWNSDDFDEGPHTIKVLAYDTNGQTAESQVTATIDRTDPSVSLTSPGVGFDLAGTVTVSADATDNIGIAAVEFTLDGDELGTATAEPYAFEWDTTGWPKGDVMIDVTATDLAGHTAHTYLLETVDNPPVVTITEPGDRDLVSGIVIVAADASDDSRVSSVAFSVDGTKESTDTVAAWEWSWDTCSTSGSHTIEALAEDDGGHTGTASITVTVDQPLEVQLLNPTGKVRGTTEPVAAYATDDLAITSVSWDVDGTVVATETTTSPETLDSDHINIYGYCTLGCSDAYSYYEGELDVTTLSAGTHTVTVTATDSAGDTATDSSSFTVE